MVITRMPISGPQIVSERELARRGHDVEAAAVSDVLFAALVGTMIGAKVYYVLVVSHNQGDSHARVDEGFWLPTSGRHGAARRLHRRRD